jgi:tRNA 5-methylaminomethyl-2-thiouridine biosynthesis bifunctional protein
MPRLPPAPELSWSKDGSSLSARAFDDVYYSKEGGLAESEAVFLAGTGLPDAWRHRERFALCELGFGTGLNLLAAWRAWKLSRRPHAQLHISTIEAFPLARDDAARALAQFPELAEIAAKLLGSWPVRAYAPQRLWFPEDGLSITLHTGDAETVLAGLEVAFDAWFLDGFAPAANPRMWSGPVLQHVARLSAPGARLASFTVAGEVRRGLERLGFKVERKRGFGKKRERLEAVWTGPHAASASLYPYGACEPARVAILGAGVAGAACAQALVRRGVEAVVVEAAPALGAGASGNPVGLVMPRLDRGGPLASFYLGAYLHAVAAYEALGVFTPCGVEQLAQKDGEEALADLLRDPPLPEDWLRPFVGGALHVRAGLANPVQAAERMLQGASVLFEATVGGLDRAESGWIVRAADGRALLKADAVVLACGAQLKRFAPAAFLPIALSRGQIEWGEGHAPPRARTQGSYVAPYQGGVLFGATFDKADAVEAEHSEELCRDARQRNIAALSALAPEIAATLRREALTSRVSFRATTPDRAPVAGLLPDAEAWLKRYAALAQGGRVDLREPAPAHAGVYVIGGLGARGLTHAPLLGEVIAGEMCGEPELLSRTARDALHPARFLHRALKRR